MYGYWIRHQEAVTSCIFTYYQFNNIKNTTARHSFIGTPGILMRAEDKVTRVKVQDPRFKIRALLAPGEDEPVAARPEAAGVAATAVQPPTTAVVSHAEHVEDAARARNRPMGNDEPFAHRLGGILQPKAYTHFYRTELETELKSTLADL